jgi:hypothetical protein
MIGRALNEVVKTLEGMNGKASTVDAGAGDFRPLRAR